MEEEYIGQKFLEQNGLVFDVCPEIRSCANAECGLVIKHTGRCRVMSCPKCQTDFCFVCGKLFCSACTGGHYESCPNKTEETL